MSESVESILASIRQGRTCDEHWKRLSSGKCYVCFGEITGFRSGMQEMRFCGDLCNLTEYITSHLFPLGMKRALPSDMDAFGLRDLPKEIQAGIILMVFHYRIKSVEEWKELMKLKLLVDQFNKRLVDEEVIPRIRSVTNVVLNFIPVEDALKFRGVEKLRVNTEKLSQERDWNFLIGKMSKLVDLTFIGGSRVDLEIGRLLQLTRLVTNAVPRNSDIMTLVNLRSLSIGFPHSDDSLLRALTNLTRLKIDWRYSEVDTMITKNGLLQLKNLEKFSFNDPSITNEHLHQLTQLKSLSMVRAQNINNIESLTNLRRLSISSMDQGGLLDSSLTKLHKLKKFKCAYCARAAYTGLQYFTNLRRLSLVSMEYRKEIDSTVFRNLSNLEKLRLTSVSGISDSDILFMTKLKLLDLSKTSDITDKGIIPLTNLTYLDITANSKITRNALRHLTNLRRLKESHERTYVIENGIIRLTK